MIKAEVPLPASYSPTIMPLTFSLFLQLAVIQRLHMATMDIKSAYLNATGLLQHWSHISQRYAVWTPPRSIASPTLCMASLTPAGCSTNTTKPLS